MKAKKATKATQKGKKLSSTKLPKSTLQRSASAALQRFKLGQR
jgi:hypothetical protein